MSDGRVISHRIRDLCKDFLAVTEGYVKKNNPVMCWKFKGCPQEIMNECPAALENLERWCWIAAGSIGGAKVPLMQSSPWVSFTECDIYKAAHMRNS